MLCVPMPFLKPVDAGKLQPTVSAAK